MTSADLHAAVPGTFLAGVEPSERSTIAALGIVRRFPRGSTLIFQDEPDDRVMVVLAGRVKVGRIEQDGRELMLEIRDPGDLLGELAFVDGGPRVATVTALEPVEALVMPAGALRAHLEVTPRTAVVLLEIVVRRLRESTLARSRGGVADTMGRLAARIVELADRYGQPCEEGVSFTLPLTQQDLAAWTGASRAGVAVALRSFRELGWIRTERRSVVVTDLNALRARAA
jgi:CRP/FNR family transcriptional regulator, cyclic AMP receptor protein